MYRLLHVLLYNTGIYLDEYTAWKVILDEPLKDYSIYIPYCTVQYFIKFYISLNESLSPDAYSCKCVFKDKRLHDHVFLHSDTFYGQRLLSLKNNGKVHLHPIIQYK